MRVIVISGFSGSGKSVALHALEDLDFYCVDNIPAGLLNALIKHILERCDSVFENVGVGLDARNRPDDVDRVPGLIGDLKASGIDCELLFLLADDEVLMSRFSETRRKHPLSVQGAGLREAIAKERDLLGSIINAADVLIDTSKTSAHELRGRIRERVGKREPHRLSILIESFGYKHGLPADADFVFDVRCLPNPYWVPELRDKCGRDEEVKAFLGSEPEVAKMIDDIAAFLRIWIPRYEDFQRSYLTVAIGCTGGQHRSVYIADRLANELSASYGQIQTLHHELPGR
ncbi:MAG TPA: RNase adapter RapZ [Gammaproteobacteria bacterium]|nr:RNase adapter RapZ [Gammaproteobacteria bacterium]